LVGTPTANNIGLFQDIIISVTDLTSPPVSLDAFQIEVVEGEPNLAPGNFNGDENVDLTDAILGLQVLTAIETPYLYIETDVNGDGKIGVQDVLYVLRTISQQ
jgi:hypothetical protein